MPRKKRSSSRVLRDMARDKEKRDAKESTSPAREDRADAGDSQATSSRPTSAAPSREESDSKTESASGGPAAEEKAGLTDAGTTSTTSVHKQQASQTEAKAKVRIEEAPKVTRKPHCPNCQENRFFEGQEGQKVTCPNCRQDVTIV